MRTQISRRLMLGALAAPALASGVLAQDSRPLQLVVGYAPGGGSDMMARILAEGITRAGGRQAVVRNTPGAGGAIAAATVLRDGLDGSQILALNHPDLLLAVLRPGSGLRAADFQVMMVDVRDPRLMIVRKESDIPDFAAFVARARARPGALAVSATAGGGQELLGKWLNQKLGMDVTIAGYRGGADAANALLAGDVAANIGDDFSRMPQRDIARGLFVGAGRRSPRWPEAPTLAEALAPFGITPPTPDFLARIGIYVVPARLKAEQPALYQRLQQTLLAATETPEYRAYIARQNLSDMLIARPGEEFEAGFLADMAATADLR
jgi:tripartite-type tricarboxylate transporter receptor subunit TctC